MAFQDSRMASERSGDGARIAQLVMADATLLGHAGGANSSAAEQPAGAGQVGGNGARGS